MPCTPLNNYLRAERRKAGLSQAEASRLVGLKNGMQFSRYERNETDPSYRVVLACEQVFGVPANDLFAGFYAGVTKQTKRRVRRFERSLCLRAAIDASRKFRCKLHWISDCLGRLGRHAYGA